MRADHLRAHAAYCQARMQAAQDTASRRRWESECADWLSLEQELPRMDLVQVETRLAALPEVEAAPEPRSFAARGR